MQPYDDPPRGEDWPPGSRPGRERRPRSKTPNHGSRAASTTPEPREHSPNDPAYTQAASPYHDPRASYPQYQNLPQDPYDEELQRGRDAWLRNSVPEGGRKSRRDGPAAEKRSSRSQNVNLALSQSQDAAVIIPARTDRSQRQHSRTRESRESRDSRIAPPEVATSSPPSQGPVDNWNMAMPDAMEQLSLSRHSDLVDSRDELPPEYRHDGMWEMETASSHRRPSPTPVRSLGGTPPPFPTDHQYHGAAAHGGQYGTTPLPGGQYGAAPPPGGQYGPTPPAPQYMDPRYPPDQQPYPPQAFPQGTYPPAYPQAYPPSQTPTYPPNYPPDYPPRFSPNNPDSLPPHHGHNQSYGQQEYPPIYQDGSAQYNMPVGPQHQGSPILSPPFPVISVDASDGNVPLPQSHGAGFPGDEKVEGTHRMIPDIPLQKANKTEVRWFASALVVFYLVSTIYYFCVRFLYTLGQGNYPAYGYFVLAVELMGVSAMVPYAVMQWRVTLTRKTPGLPAAPPMQKPVPNPWFHVRVMVPCYKEDLQVVGATVKAALMADLPPCTLRTVYLCDDGKSPEKEEFINQLRAQGFWAEYVTGRTRKPHEVNGKSGNLNNTLRNIIYDAFKDPVKNKITKAAAAEIPLSELIVVFDADMVCQKNFFLKVLEAMQDDDIALCLTPQAFSNVTTWQDLFNNINVQFWQYILPGSNAMGYIACTGTNFCIRARPLATVGFFPEYTITEDYALGMELAKAGFKGTYLNEYLARGEAPTGARNVFQQRSRWTKGHMQVFFSHRCPVFNYKLSFANKWLYTNGTWAYFATIITTPTFIIVPFISLVFGIHPVAISRNFAIAATLYFFSQFLIQGYVRSWGDSTSLWWSGVSNHVLCFTYFKAVMNVLMSKVGLKRVGFKATEKVGKPNALQRVATTARNAAEKAAAAMTKPSKKKAADKGCCYFCCCCCFPCCACCCPNLGDMQGTWDVHVLAFSFIFSMVAVGCGVLRVYLDGIFQPFTVLPIFWALYNAIPPYLFLHYMFTKNCTFKAAAFVCRILSVVFGILALGALWLSTKEPFVLKSILAGTVTTLDLSRSGPLPTSITGKFPWRGTSMKNDGNDLSLNLTGGFFVNGASNVKWNFPLASSLAMMTWGYVEFPQSYKAAGAKDRFLANLRWGGDYMMNAHKDDWSFVAQVGDPEQEAQKWIPPEQDDSQRPSYLLTKDKGGADMFAAASASLSAMAVAFNGSDDKYSRALLGKAKSLFELAKQTENTTYCNYERTGIRCYLEEKHACPGEPTTESGRRLLSNTHALSTPRNPHHRARNLLQSSRGLLQSTPSGSQNTEPTPSGSQNTGSTPSGSQNTGSTPSGSQNTEPTPSGSQNTEPTPSGSQNTAPASSAPPPPPCNNVTYSTYYNSSSSYDDLAWAAAWLFKATGEAQYKKLVDQFLEKHKKYESNYGEQSYYVSNWNNMMWSTNMLMYGITKEDQYGSLVKAFVKTWVTGKSDLYRWPNGNDFWALSHTPKGLAFTPNQTLPQLSNALFLTHLYTKAAPIGGVSDIIRCWVREQLNYMLGKKGSSERSYLVGFGDKYPKQAMSRSGSCANPITGTCSWEQTFNMSANNPNILVGALVNGPDNKDGFVDVRSMDGNRVGLDNNAGFMGLVAAEMAQAAPEAVCQERHGLYNTMFEEKQVQNKLKKTLKDRLRQFFGFGL